MIWHLDEILLYLSEEDNLVPYLQMMWSPNQK